MFASEQRLVELRSLIDGLEAEFLDALAAYDRSGDLQASGFLSTTSALRQLCRMDPGRAASEVALARKEASGRFP
jgi:hypothetical protein